MTQADAYGLPAGSGARWADQYEVGRPGWPPEVVRLAGPPSATVLDLGAGTGKLTRLLVPYFSRVIAVEPQEAMRSRLVELCPGAQAVDGIADRVPLADAAIDAVFVAEAFHKFGSERSVHEIARVLRPAGLLLLLWNVPAGPVEPSIAVVDRLLDRMLAERGLSADGLGYDPGDLNPARFSSGEWRHPFAGSPFGEFREVRLRHTQVLDRDGIVAFLASMGWIADLPDPERLPVLDEISSALTATEYCRQWEARVFLTRQG